MATTGFQTALSGFNGIKTAVDQVLKPAPDAHDGKYQSEAIPTTERSGFIPDLLSQLNRLPQDAEVFSRLIMALKKGSLTDDKQYGVSLDSQDRERATNFARPKSSFSSFLRCQQIRAVLIR